MRCYQCWHYRMSGRASAINPYKKECERGHGFVYPGQRACDDFLDFEEEWKRRKAKL